MKSKITKITYEEVKNLGNYETCRVGAEAIVAESDNPTTVMHKLKRWVATQLDKGPYNDGE